MVSEREIDRRRFGNRRQQIREEDERFEHRLGARRTRREIYVQSDESGGFGLLRSGSPR